MLHFWTCTYSEAYGFSDVASRRKSCVVLKMDLKELINAVYYCFFTINSDVNEDVRDVILEVVHMKDCAYLTKSIHSVCTFWGFVWQYAKKMMLRFLAINVHDAECISASGGKCNIVTFIFSAFFVWWWSRGAGDSDELFGGSVPYMAFMLEMTSAWLFYECCL